MTSNFHLSIRSFRTFRWTSSRRPQPSDLTAEATKAQRGVEQLDVSDLIEFTRHPVELSDVRDSVAGRRGRDRRVFVGVPRGSGAGGATAGCAQPTAQQPTPPPADDPVQTLVGRLDLEKYKATIKGLTQFGDRRQGTDRNRAAVDWIDAQLKSYGCPTDRIKYEHVTAAARPGSRSRRRRARARRARQQTSRPGRQHDLRHDRTDRREQRPDGAAGREAPRAQHTAGNRRPARAGLLHEGRNQDPRRDVHRRRTHGRHRLGRGGQRRRLGHGARDGAGANPQQSGRADGAHDSIRALEQRRDGPERRDAPTSRSVRHSRARKIRRAQGVIPNRNGSG